MSWFLDFFFQSIAAQKAAEVVPSPASQTVNKTANKPMETVVLPSTVNEDINDIRAFDKTTGNPSYINNAETNTRESEVQVQRLTFGDDDDAANEMEYSNPVTDQFIFAHTKFPVLRHDGFFENSMRAATGPVVSEVDSNFSRQVTFCV